MRVEYIDNNGYIIETDKAVYVFDFVEGLLPSTYLRSGKPLILLVSNGNPEFYSESIYVFKKTIIYSNDIKQEPYNKVFQMFPGDMVHLGFAKVHALGSNREGLIYIIEEDGKRFMHAGNFNNWHYQEYSTEKRVEIETSYFLEILDSLKDFKPLDILIFPVNATMGYNYDHGAKRAIRVLKPKHFFPTQFKRGALIQEFASWSAQQKDTETHIPKFTNQKFEVEI